MKISMYMYIVINCIPTTSTVNYFDLFLPEGDLGVAFCGCGLLPVCCGTDAE